MLWLRSRNAFYVLGIGRSVVEIDANQVAVGVPAVDATIGERRRGPTFSTHDLETGKGSEAFRGCLQHHQLPPIEQEELIAGTDHATIAKSRLRPCNFARVEIKGGKMAGAMGGAVDGVEVSVDEDRWVEVRLEALFMLPEDLRVGCANLQQSAAGFGRNEDSVIRDDGIGGIDITRRFPWSFPENFAGVRFDGNKGLGREDGYRVEPVDLKWNRRRVARSIR